MTCIAWKARCCVISPAPTRCWRKPFRKQTRLRPVQEMEACSRVRCTEPIPACSTNGNGCAIRTTSPARLKTSRDQAPDITRNKREFTALIRTEIFRFLKPLAMENYAGAIASLGPTTTWKADELAVALRNPYFETHERIRLDPEARNGQRHTDVERFANVLACSVRCSSIPRS